MAKRIGGKGTSKALSALALAITGALIGTLYDAVTDRQRRNAMKTKGKGRGAPAKRRKGKGKPKDKREMPDKGPKAKPLR